MLRVIDMRRYSVGPKTTKFPKEDLPIAYMGTDFNDAFVCQAGVQGYSKVACNRNCTYCMKTKGDVAFVIH